MTSASLNPPAFMSAGQIKQKALILSLPLQSHVGIRKTAGSGQGHPGDRAPTSRLRPPEASSPHTCPRMRIQNQPAAQLVPVSSSEAPRPRGES